MSKPKKYNIVDTYFYDFHSLEISIETSKIMVSSIELELNTAASLNDHGNVYLLNKKLDTRKKLLLKQQEQLLEMKKVIKSFPENFKNSVYDIYYLAIVENKPVYQIAEELGFTHQYIYKIRSKILDDFKKYLEIT